MSDFIDQLPGGNNCRYSDGQNSKDVVITSLCRSQDLALSRTFNTGRTNTLSTTIQGQGNTKTDGLLVTTPVPDLVNGTTISSTIIPTLQPGNSNAAIPASPTAGHDKSGKGLAAGAVAGIAIGMLLAGASIAALVFLLLLRRQKKRQNTSPTTHSPQRLPYSGHESRSEKGLTVVTAAVDKVDDLLPQPVEDDAIAGALSKIRDNIKNHVRTYYHYGPVPAADINEASVRNIAALTGSSAAILSSALTNPATRGTALRSVMGSIILARCSGERNLSLLSGELAGLVTSISESGAHTSQPVLFSKWKVITGALLQQRFGRQNQGPGLVHGFQDVIVSLDSVLAPFVKGSVDFDQRRKNMDMILTRAANFSFLLFAQPGSFHLNFTNRQGGWTVFPALVQTVSDQGQPLIPVKVLTEQEVVAE